MGGHEELSALLAEIEAGPEGPEIGVFFDFDGTLIAGYSAEAFVLDAIRRRKVDPQTMVRSLLAGLDMHLRGSDVTALMEIAAEAGKGRREEALIELGQRLFRERLAGTVYPEARALVKAHQRKGHTVALASSATRFQAAPLASDLGIEHVLCTKIEVVDGRLTGRVDGPVLWGRNKADAVADFAAEAGLKLADSYGYANGDEDVEFLETVGRARPLNPGSGLAKVAAERGWPIHRFEPRGRPGIVPVVRTAAALGGIATSLGVGVGIGLLNRSRRKAVNVVATVAPEVALGLAGVDLRVTGEKHLWSDRPAVFVFNHQSSFDVIVISRLLQRDFTAVAKAELAHDPRFAPLAALAGVVYVDRGNRSQSRAALAPVVEKLRSGISLAMAPEGTRSATPTPGPFKKGAFHIAVQAEVPVVPVVIRNAGDIMWRASLVARPGTVDVTVLPPVPTVGLGPDEVDDLCERVREQFVATLADWPS
ncbi:MAG: putative phosphoserine phosphatase / 1-acylglycerol-3-phosphate O-acyltransferase [Actinomycetota bacterium]|jgi:putative phosphoserine phosphatase/1-acylglycerol-3-phosphate O-acyltransferase|nr:putative phosphoserine phosphatase / 1-acylglycerol-3-phosphate O-acyltransferase [Actinomycetota bacterium]